MGKDICFFITEDDATNLISKIKSFGGFEVDEYKANNNYFFALPDSKIVYTSYNGRKKINPIESDVIELSCSVPQPAKILDMSLIEKNFRKGDFVVVDDSSKFNRLMNELKENPIYIDNPNYIFNGYKNGRIWFENQYYVNGNRKNKSKKIMSLFSAIKKHIQKEYVLSVDKGYYIGPDAFQKYKQGTFVPCSGKNVVEFKTGDGSLSSDYKTGDGSLSSDELS